jgi:hypothetical protein
MDVCPARIEPHPPDVPTHRQVRVVDQVVMWLDGLDVRAAPLPAGSTVRRAGCPCTANPRLTGAAAAHT